MIDVMSNLRTFGNYITRAFKYCAREGGILGHIGGDKDGLNAYGRANRVTYDYFMSGGLAGHINGDKEGLNAYGRWSKNTFNKN